MRYVRVATNASTDPARDVTKYAVIVRALKKATPVIALMTSITSNDTRTDKVTSQINIIHERKYLSLKYLIIDLNIFCGLIVCYSARNFSLETSESIDLRWISVPM